MQNTDNEVEMRYKAMLERCNVEYEPSVNNTEQIDTTYGSGVGFQRLRRITGYLVGDVSRWNNGKKAELNDREHHTYKEE